MRLDARTRNRFFREGCHCPTSTVRREVLNGTAQLGAVAGPLLAAADTAEISKEVRTVREFAKEADELDRYGATAAYRAQIDLFARAVQVIVFDWYEGRRPCFRTAVEAPRHSSGRNAPQHAGPCSCSSWRTASTPCPGPATASTTAS